MSLFSALRRLFTGPWFPKAADVLVVGLGNPGGRYARTRHNVGFRVVDAVLDRLQGRVDGRNRQGEFSTGTLGGKTVMAVRPLTYMNNSGTSVEFFVKRLGLPLTAVLIIVDDFNIPLGSIRARRGGSDGGHNGLKSITAHVGSEFPRLRVGIGPKPPGIDVIQFVLGELSAAEEQTFGEVIPRAVSALETFVVSGIDEVMNKYNS